MIKSWLLSNYLLEYRPKIIPVVIKWFLCVFALIITELSTTTHQAYAFIPNPSPTVNVFSLAVQPDSKILVSGSYRREGSAGTAHNFLVRLNDDGSLDLNFDLETINPEIAPIQFDGKIIAVVENNHSDHDPIIRLNNDGSIDTTFKLKKVITAISAIATQPDGKILVGRHSSSEVPQLNYAIYRLNIDGSIDKTFNRIVLGGESSFIRSIIVQPDGMILIGGKFNSVNGQTRSNIARLYCDGNVDTEFKPNGKSDVDTLVLQSDGKILVNGVYTQPDWQTPFPVGRLNPDGSIDASFAPDSLDSAAAIDVQLDGKVLVGGFFYLSRLDANGRIDMSFNINVYSTVHTIVTQTDGKVLLGGSIRSLNTRKGNPDLGLLGLVRLNADASLDRTFTPWTDNLIKSLAPPDSNN